jgi:hypothetical protein
VVRGIIVVMVTGYCLSKLKKIFDEITPPPTFANVKGGCIPLAVNPSLQECKRNLASLP